MTKGPIFQPNRVQRHDDTQLPPSGTGGDDRDGKTYVYHRSDIALAVNVALATRRPLLLSGPSGCGKSSLALNVALTFGHRYYEYVVTARSEARDLLWSFDNLRRLNDAQAHKRNLREDESYIEPGVLWWAFDLRSARQRGADGRLPATQEAADPSLIVSGSSAVVLIDEIDKADPDLPNNLLVPLGSMQFQVVPIRSTITGDQPPLIFITTNGERELPRAFVRRCVALELPAPTRDDLIEIAQAVIPERDLKDDLFEKVAEYVIGLRGGDDEDAASPSTAEYLDTLRACTALGIDTKHADFEDLSRITLRKDSAAGAGSWM